MRGGASPKDSRDAGRCRPSGLRWAGPGGACGGAGARGGLEASAQPPPRQGEEGCGGAEASAERPPARASRGCGGARRLRPKPTRGRRPPGRPGGAGGRGDSSGAAPPPGGGAGGAETPAELPPARANGARGGGRSRRAAPRGRARGARAGGPSAGSDAARRRSNASAEVRRGKARRRPPGSGPRALARRGEAGEVDAPAGAEDHARPLRGSTRRIPSRPGRSRTRWARSSRSTSGGAAPNRSSISAPGRRAPPLLGRPRDGGTGGTSPARRARRRRGSRRGSPRRGGGLARPAGARPAPGAPRRRAAGSRGRSPRRRCGPTAAGRGGCPRRADLEVAHGDAEARAELAVLLDRPQPPRGRLGADRAVGARGGGSAWPACSRPTRPRSWWSSARP